MCFCVRLVGTSLSCAFLSLWGLRVLYSRCTHTASCHSSLLMSWTNCSLGSVFSSPDLCGLLHPLQFLVFLNKARVPTLEMGFSCPTWWTPCWPRAIKVPLSQTRAIGSWAALGWSLPADGGRRCFSSTQHRWERPGVLCPPQSPISGNRVLEQVPQRATKTTN